MQADRNLAETASQSLIQLSGRKVIRPEFVTRLLSVDMESYPNYFGSLVWVLMMLEQWFVGHLSYSTARASSDRDAQIASARII
jgi:asparagine synthase (glutamine-hydrolysing)